jgi:hypothetical protein
MRMIRLAADNLSSQPVREKYHYHTIFLHCSQNVIVPKISHNLARILLRRLLGILNGTALYTTKLGGGKTYISVTGWRLWEEVDI